MVWPGVATTRLPMAVRAAGAIAASSGLKDLKKQATSIR